MEQRRRVRIVQAIQLVGHYDAVCRGVRARLVARNLPFTANPYNCGKIRLVKYTENMTSTFNWYQIWFYNNRSLFVYRYHKYL